MAAPGRARQACAAACVLAAAAVAAMGVRADEPAPVQKLAPGVYVLRGADAAPSPANGGRVANVGVIVGSRGAIVIGTGASDADGERLIEEIGRLGGRPIELAIDTYAGPEHVLGNRAFARRGIPVLAHRLTDRYMAQNCATCIRSLAAQVGDAVLAGSDLRRPDRLIDHAQTVSAGGRRIELLYYGPTHQPGSIAVFDRASGVLFAGGLASFDVIPDAHEADIPAWLAALDRMHALPLEAVVPGRGPVGTPARLDEVATYLRALERETRRAYHRGLGLAETTQGLDLSAFRDWAMYASAHRRNTHFQYLRLEAGEFAAAPAQ